MNQKQKKLVVEQTLPELEQGWNLLRHNRKNLTLQKLLANELEYRQKTAVWLDSRNQASTYALANIGSTELLEKVTIARAFTAYQHYNLCQKLEKEITEDTEILILPSVNEHYDNGQINPYEAEELLEKAINKLEELVEKHDLKVLYTLESGDLSFKFKGLIDNEIRVENTEKGRKYSSDDFKTRFYRENGLLQTTLPYWEDIQRVEERGVKKWGGPMPPIETT